VHPLGPAALEEVEALDSAAVASISHRALVVVAVVVVAQLLLQLLLQLSLASIGTANQTVGSRGPGRVAMAPGPIPLLGILMLQRFWAGTRDGFAFKAL
jgi:hypothetical protein